MEDATAPKHSTELIEWDDYVEKMAMPDWKARRLSISMSHNDNFETKILDS